MPIQIKRAYDASPEDGGVRMFLDRLWPRGISKNASTRASPDYLGPAAFVEAYHHIFDTRDVGADGRLAILDGKEGLRMCYTSFNCVEACLKGGVIPRWISALKRKATARR